MDPTIVVAIISAATGIATTALSLILKTRLGEVRDEVKNGHETPLRVDMDLMHTKLDYLIEGQRRHDKEIAGLRADLQQERAERMALAARLDS